MTKYSWSFVWWLRSANSNNDNNFYNVRGDWNNNNSYNSNGVSPDFCKKREQVK